MKRAVVDSSAVHSIGYDFSTRTIEVQYKDKNGKPARVYRGFPVSQEMFDELVAPGASVGRILNQKLKANPLVSWSDITDEQAVTS